MRGDTCTRTKALSAEPPIPGAAKHEAFLSRVPRAIFVTHLFPWAPVLSPDAHQIGTSVLRGDEAPNVT